MAFKMRGANPKGVVSPIKQDETYDPETQTRDSRWIFGEEGWIPDSWQDGKQESRREKVNPKWKTHHGSSVNYDGSPAATDNKGERYEDMPNMREDYLRRVAEWEESQK